MHRHIKLTMVTVLVGAALILAVQLKAAEPGNSYRVQNLVSDGFVTTAQPPDPLLVNGWGIAASATSPWWVSAADSNSSLIYNATGVRTPLVVQVAGGPTGIVSSSGTGFVVTGGAASGPARFMRRSEPAWNIHLVAWHGPRGHRGVVRGQELRGTFGRLEAGADTRRGSRRRGQGFGPLRDAEQHAAGHDESRRLDRQRQQPRPGGAGTHAAARHESCVGVVDRVQTKLPDPIKISQAPHVQHERALRFDGRDRPARTLPQRNLVADREMLKLRENAGGAWTIQVAEEAVQPVVAIEAAAPIAHLNQPGPHMFRPGVDDDGHRA